MFKTIKMEEKESTKITIPPLSGDEEGKEIIMDLEEKSPHEEVAELEDSTTKFSKLIEGREKGVLQEDLFNAQKLLNGRNPSPKAVRQYTAKFRYYLLNYGEKEEDEKFYLKVDSKKIPVAKVMFNDDKERSFSITSHVINMDLQRNFFPVDVSQRVMDLFTRDSLYRIPMIWISMQGGTLSFFREGSLTSSFMIS